MDYTKFVPGVILSPRDDRDYKISKLVAMADTFPEEYVIPYNHPIKDQGNIGKCVAAALAYNRAIIEEMQSGIYNEFSEDFIYANRQTTDFQESGMVPREALKNLLSYGVCFKSDFSYEAEYPDILEPFNKVKGALLSKAYPHRITAYASINTDNEIKTALMKLGPVLAIYTLYRTFYNTGSDGIVSVPNEYRDGIVGNHAMTIIGWRKDNKWVVLNSWGDQWGDKGICYIPFEYHQQEMWTITDTIIPKKEETKVKKLIIMNDLPDRDIAGVLNADVGAYTVYAKDYITDPVYADIVYVVGGNAQAKGGKVVVLSGANRKETNRKVLEYLKTL